MPKAHPLKPLRTNRTRIAQFVGYVCQNWDKFKHVPTPDMWSWYHPPAKGE